MEPGFLKPGNQEVVSETLRYAEGLQWSQAS